MRVRAGVPVIALAALSGCATTSFAPPSVYEDKAVSADGKCPVTAPTGNAVDQDVVGALQIVDNYRLAYNCAFRNLANGRQGFEVPSALALAGGATAAALGVGPDVAIATGAASAIFNRGNGYYAPKDKAQIVAAALDAVICIKREASGVGGEVKNGVQPMTKLAAVVGGGSVDLDPELQYFQLVTANLQTVHAILGERLMSVGSFSPSAIADDIRKLSDELAKAESSATQTAVQNNLLSLGLTSGTGLDAAVSSQLSLKELAPKLELCTLRAKAG